MGKYAKQRGFTIVEIMGVVAIIGILAILTLPSVKANAVRAKMAEVMLAFGPCKAAITELYLSGGEFPGDNEIGCEQPGPNVTTYVDSVTSKDGVLKVSLHGFQDGRLDAHTVTLAPLDNTGNLTLGGGGGVARWRCGSPVDNTDVSPQYLPSSCRG